MVNEDLGSLLGKIEQILPVLKENAAQNEKDRWLTPATLDALQSAGVLRMWTPKRFGGLELSLAEQVSVIQLIATACLSTGWTCGLWAGGTFIASRFPESALSEIFAEPDTKSSSVFSPNGKLVSAPGGYELSGAWKFNTGCRGAQWDGLAAIIETTGELAYVMVPTSALIFDDDWFAFGAKGTGSSQTRASNSI
jgi:3-hydroxy-9,10-secoandrosta-1,3,5(10)-triene-9,17-dione monooxygenase